jgi:hypothetical protein
MARACGTREKSESWGTGVKGEMALERRDVRDSRDE